MVKEALTVSGASLAIAVARLGKLGHYVRAHP
jgi:hypothetical protein